ncbi:putative sodium-dependent transporter YocR isoform X2 [Branchiostoma floridae x Branchiostoma japonicum]
MADEGKSERIRLVKKDADHSELEAIFQTTSESHPDTDRAGRFSSKLGLIISCVGCAVGTGNLWRFPRILANNSGEKGCLQFLLVWLVFLFLWSMQFIIMEYAIGRFTRRAPPMAWHDLLGVKSTWLGGWISIVNFLMTCYYGVVVGWSIHYMYYCIFHPLPTNFEESSQIWKAFAEESSWPVLLHFLATAASVLVMWKGVNSIEPAMKVMIPGLLILVITAFIWALTQHNAGTALAFIFTPDWQLLGTPRLWIDALSQNAWDTGAACGIFLVYGASMTQSMGPVKTGALIPFLNNTVSLMSGTMVFCTVFSTWTKVSPGGDKDDLMKLLKTNGPANTGLTFVWMPILFSTMTGGRVMASLYFLMVVVAGFSSYFTAMNSTTQVLVDWGVRRNVASVVVGTLVFLLGVPSAVNVSFLAIQDFIWGAALIISGLVFIYLFWRYGSLNFRLNLLNEAGDGSDWKLPKAWEWLVKYVLPVEGLALLVWWVVSTVRNEKIPWYQLGEGSLMTAILGWFVVGLVLLGLNLVFVRYRARMSRCWSSLIAKQEDIPACCWGHRQDRGDRDNSMTMTDQAKEAPVLEYNTID